MTRNTGILVFDEIEILDFAGPYEVFSVASRVKARQEPGSKAPFNVFTVGQGPELTKARGNLRLRPHFSFSNHPPVDLLVIPGGIVTGEIGKDAVIRWITETAGRAEIVASVCTGAFLLAKAGLLDGKRATTHWEDAEDLKAMFPRVRVENGPRWVEEGKIITSAGISAGIDMSLHLVERLEGEKLALATARQMDYRWIRDGG
jgi:transcriptional regulator GlxA family with amidase domain